MNVRLAESRDLDSILAIQSSTPQIAQWTVEDYRRVVSGGMTGWVAAEGDEIFGFIVARRVSDDIEILNFAVRPAEQRKGVGSTLLRAALAWGRKFQATNAFLEVRISNNSALLFYQHRGFQVTGRRRNYYAAPVEDALLLTAPIAISSLPLR